MLLELLQDLVRVQLEVAHHLGKRVPLDLREREKHVLVRQQRVVTSSGFLDSPVHDALCRLTNLALCDVEVVHGTSSSNLTPVSDRGQPELRQDAGQHRMTRSREPLSRHEHRRSSYCRDAFDPKHGVAAPEWTLYDAAERQRLFDGMDRRMTQDWQMTDPGLDIQRQGLSRP
jgi:hypothetical protein